MATPIAVPTPITTLQFTTIDANTASNEVILTGAKIVLTPAQLKSRLTVSVVKSSEITDVNTSLVKSNTTAVPSTLDIPTYQADILYLANLKQRQAVLLQQYNEITALVEVSQHNLMIKTNAILTNARIVAKTDKGVADAMDVLDGKYFTHAAPGAGITHAIVEAGVITLPGINPGKPFTNTEAPVLSILNVGGSAANTVRVNGFTSVVLPATWVNIIVTNLSTTDPGGFEVFMK
jgi:hypothetical protein